MIREIMKDTAFLSQKAEPATLEDLPAAEDLLETLKAHKESCVGMAANMIGVNKRIIAFEDGKGYTVMFNPEIIKRSGPYEIREGCLSLPGMWGKVSRPNWVRVRAQDRDGNWFETEGEEMTARCFCHELAHLDGHMYDELTDRLYTAEELDEILAKEENQTNQPKREGRGRRRR